MLFVTAIAEAALLMKSAVVDVEAAAAVMSAVGYDIGIVGASNAAAVLTSCVLRGLPTKAAADGSSVDSKNKQRIDAFIVIINLFLYISQPPNRIS